jgi:pimeloyl-ACP methyl ester carboxylesterase
MLAAALPVMTALASPAGAAASEGRDRDAITTQTVCFTAHNGDDPTPVSLTGTLFTPRHVRPTTPVIVTVHGLASDRSVWDGWFFGPAAGSFARELAGDGYAVVTYDRIGYGDSPYARGPGSGYAVTLDTQLGALHEVVGQVHVGSYTLAGGSGCPGGARAPFGSRTVVLAGHSAGSLLVESYAGTYHDVAGVVALTSSTFGPSAELVDEVIDPWVVPQLEAGNDYPTFMPPNPVGTVSRECLEFFFHLSGGDRSRFRFACANRSLEPSPGGEFISAGPFTARTHALVSRVGRLPVLLVFADRDRIFPGPELAGPHRPDVVTPEIAYWRKTCGCALSTYTQRDSGHFLQLQASFRNTVDRIEDWLDRSL